MTVTITPGSPEHSRLISPSKVAAILGVSRWESPYRLWHRMKGLTPPEPPKDIFVVGHAMEHALAYLWREQNPGWQLSPDEVQITSDALGFPTVTTLDRRARRGRGRKVVEFKLASSLEQWGDEFTDEAPMDYIAQVQAQMLFTGLTRQPADLLVMGPRFRHHTYSIPFDPEIGQMIADRCAAFYASLESDTSPDLDDTVATYECVRELHPDIDGAEVQVDPTIALDHLLADHRLTLAETEARRAKTALLAAMGTAKSAYVDGIKVADRRPASRGGVALYTAKKSLTALTETKEEVA